MWVSTQQINNWPGFLHSLDTGETLDCNEAIHQLSIDFKKAYD
jgi:hypothetical protein